MHEHVGEQLDDVEFAPFPEVQSKPPVKIQGSSLLTDQRGQPHYDVDNQQVSGNRHDRC